MFICGATTQGSIKTNKHNLGDIYTLGFVCQLLARVQVSGVWSSACGAFRSGLVRKRGLEEGSYGFGDAAWNETVGCQAPSFPAQLP